MSHPVELSSSPEGCQAVAFTVSKIIPETDPKGWPSIRHVDALMFVCGDRTMEIPPDVSTGPDELRSLAANAIQGFCVSCPNRNPVAAPATK